MKAFKNFPYYLKEAFRNMRYFSLLSLTSISTITVVLTILCFFMLLSENLKSVSKQLEKEITISVFIEKIPTTARNNMIMQLRKWENVKSVNFISGDKAIKSLENDLSMDMDKLLKEFGENPLPDVVEIKPKSPDDIEKIITLIKQKFTWIIDISYGKEVVTKIIGLSKSFRLFATLLLIVLGTSSLFIIANTIRLTLFARKDEIDIMSLIGATRTFICMPYYIEGIFQGLIGSLIAVSLCYFGYKTLTFRLQELLPFTSFLPGLSILPKIAFKISMIGILIGFFGSYFSLKKNFEK